MRRVVVVYLAMLVLVVAQAHQEKESSSSTGQAPIASVASLPGDEGKTPPGSDCVDTCPTQCWLLKHIPKHYEACLELCKKHCNDGHVTDAIFACTFACADSMPIRQLASDHAVGGNVEEACFEKCKKNR
ncbi:hypothetical protein I3842_02G144000 [Carya illinoinensis]|uniref:Uncharacterized protein n=1 Tax=Carya illinoinensis TaxID=32201 RepID=A0A922K1H1_CARIL|nr:hypothetical protein I3842_02G144000 [Carya illinoinensis]